MAIKLFFLYCSCDLAQVEELILEDSRIDQYPKVIKGESKVVLEWQGTNIFSTPLIGPCWALALFVDRE
jgi:hypothetical protein